MLQQINRDFVPWVLHLLYPLIETADRLLSYLIGNRDVEALLVLLGVAALFTWLRGRFFQDQVQPLKMPPRNEPFKALRLFAFAFLVLVALQYPRSGVPFCEVVTLKETQMKDHDARMTRYLLPNEKKGGAENYELGWLYKNNLPMSERVESLLLVTERGGDAFCVKGRSIYFLSANIAPGSGVENVLAFHKRSRYAGWILTGVLLLALVSLLPEMGSIFCTFQAWMRRQGELFPAQWTFWRPGVLIAVAFCLVFGSHQWRFGSQDLRMQVLTSHPDDGCMLERIRDGAAKGTMDPWAVSNCAYGALAYSHLAFPSWAAQMTGLQPSDAFISLSVRWIKTLVSGLCLIAVYALGARFFSVSHGVIGALLVATDREFLMFSSMPFYPDVLMAGLNTAGLIFALSLVREPRMDRFFSACLWCGFGAGMKYLAVVSGPFIVACLLLGRWRTKDDAVWRLLCRGVQDSVLGAVLFGLCFLASNPYLDYLKGWIIPNVGRATQVVASDNNPWIGAPPATFSQWLGELKGQAQLDTPYLWLFLAAGLWIAAQWFITRKKGIRSGEPWLERLLLFGYVLVYLTFIIKSVTVAGNVGARLLFIAKWPLFILALTPVISLLDFGRRKMAAPWMSYLAWAILLAFAFIPRISSAGIWLQNYGKLAPPHDVAAWLEANKIPSTSWIMCGPYPYIPPQYRSFDGWSSVGLPGNFGTERNPAIFVEDRSWVDERYLVSRSRQDVPSLAQWEAYVQHREFYSKLRTSEVFPYIFSANGQEHIGRMAGDGAISTVSIYINRYLGAPNLLSEKFGAKIEEAVNIPIDGEKGIRKILARELGEKEQGAFATGTKGQWPQTFTIALASPAAVETVLIGWATPGGLPGEFSLEGQTTDQQWLPLQERSADTSEKTSAPQQFYMVPDGKVLQRIRLSIKSSLGADGIALTNFAAFPVCPQHFNNTAACFDITTRLSDWSKEHPASGLFSTRFKPAEYALASNSEDDVTLLLKPKFNLSAKRLLLAFKDSDTLPERVEITIEKPGDIQKFTLLENSFSLNAAKYPFVESSLKEAGTVAEIRVNLVRKKGSRPLGLRQCYIESVASPPLSISPKRVGP